MLKWLPLTLVLPLAVGPAVGQESASVAAGRKLALCAKCHVVAEGQSAPVLHPPAPSFAAIAARVEVTQASLQAFLARPHGETRRESSMPSFMLHPADVDVAVAYLLSLKRLEK